MILRAHKLTGKKVLALHTDNAKELRGGATKVFLDENNSLLEDFTSHSPQSNGRAERSSRTMYEKKRTVLANLHTVCTLKSYKSLWPEARRGVVYVNNRSLTNNIHKGPRGKTPHKLITDEKQNLSNLRNFSTHVKALKRDSYHKGRIESKIWNALHVASNLAELSARTYRHLAASLCQEM